jgi:hypothetical protein
MTKKSSKQSLGKNVKHTLRKEITSSSRGVSHLREPPYFKCMAGEEKEKTIHKKD